MSSVVNAASKGVKVARAVANVAVHTSSAVNSVGGAATTVPTVVNVSDTAPVPVEAAVPATDPPVVDQPAEHAADPPVQPANQAPINSSVARTVGRVIAIAVNGAKGVRYLCKGLLAGVVCAVGGCAALYNMLSLEKMERFLAFISSSVALYDRYASPPAAPAQPTAPSSVGIVMNREAIEELLRSRTVHLHAPHGIALNAGGSITVSNVSIGAPVKREKKRAQLTKLQRRRRQVHADPVV